MGRTPHVLRLGRHELERELYSLRLRTRIFMFVAAASMLFGSVGYGQSGPLTANSGGLDFKPIRFTCDRIAFGSNHDSALRLKRL